MPYQPRPTRRIARIWTIFSLVIISSLLLSQAAPVIEAATIARTSIARSNHTVPINQIVGSDVIGSDEDTDAGGLTITLSEGAAQPDDVERPPVAEAQLLTDDDLQLILDRLPALGTEAADVQEFRLPSESLPAPRPGLTVVETFPPAQPGATIPAAPTGPLEVLRFSPDGEIPIAPFLNVTFNQPMVALGTLEQLTAADVPVQITPEIPGRWKWLGTKTLSFEYASEDVDRFPMATEFTVEIPAGTESATGGTLAETVTWSFTTPAPQIVTFMPSGSPQPRNPLLFVSFNQRIDPAAVLDTISVTAGGDSYTLMLASAEEIAQNEAIQSAVQTLDESGRSDQWLAFRATEEFPANTTVVVNIGPGTPSAEGPLTTGHVQSFSFQTYAPLRVVEYQCGYGECPPFAPFTIQFNNPIDRDAFDEQMVSVEPAIVGLDINLFGGNMVIQGATQGRTTYEVTLSQEMRDIFGQTLGEDVTLEFAVGSAFPMLSGPNDGYITLDPSTDRPVFTVYSINYERLRVRAYKVTPADWNDYLTYRQNYYGQEKPPEPPGDEVLREIFTVQAQPDELAETSIDLSAALGGSTGHLIVIVDFPPNPLLGQAQGRQYDNLVQTWVQVTKIGLDAFVDSGNMTVWANALTDGAPLANVDLQLHGANVSGTTSEDGTALLPLSDQMGTLLVAQQGDDIAILPPNQYIWGGDGWRRVPQSDELRWYVMDDRGMYRPEEEVHVKGFVRRIGRAQDSDVALIGGAQNSVRYVVMDPQGNQIVDGTASVSALGGFDFAFTLPENINLGHSNVQLTLAGNVSNLDSREYWHGFQVQEFRRPEFEVTAGNETTGPYFVKGADDGNEATEAVIFASAQYFAGGSLPNAETFWSVTTTPTSYSPPNWPDFTFGTWVPWWRFYNESFPVSGGGHTLSYNATTDAAGRHYLRISFDKAAEPRPYSVVADATVMDVNRQAWAASTSLLVHPAHLYVGLRSTRTFVELGEPLEVDAIVTDLDGNAVAGRTVAMQAARLDWDYRDGQWQEVEVDAQECSVESQGEPVTCTFTTDIGGSYRITATVIDDAGRPNESQLLRWVSGGQRPPARNIEQEEALLIPNQEEYQPGDEAEILVQSPFVPAEGLLTVARSGILYTQRFTMDEASYTLRIPIEDAHIPNLTIQVDLVGSAPRVDDQGEPVENVPPRPAYATGTLDLSVPPLSRTLDLAIEPQETALEPGGSTTIDLTLTDADGAPVADAELVAVVVDEAILALSNYQLADPIATFYSNRWADLRSYYSRATIVLANPDALLEQAQGVGGGADALNARSLAAPAAAPTADMAFAAETAAMEESAMDGDMSTANQAQQPITVRTNFNPLAIFAPAVQTDADGRAQVEVQLPDNLTRYRVMVVAVADGKYFGSGESNLTARLPLMVRPSAPRFLNFGDHVELPVVIQNQTDQEMAVQVGVRVSNISVDEEILPASTGKSVTVPANDRVEVRFPVGTLNAGTARVQIAAVSGTHADAATVDLPVYTPATTEAFASYGVIDEDVNSGGALAQPLRKPENVFTQFGGLEINTSSTALQALTDAVLYLATYPYECSEQLASRVLAVAALRDVLTAFEAEGLPAPEELVAAVQRDIDRLQSLQNFDGGWPIWRKGQDSVPFYSIHVAHALQRAEEKGFVVPEEMQLRALDHLRNIEQFYPHWYSEKVRHTLSSYAVYVRMLMGDVDTAKARDLFGGAALNNQSLEAVAWLWQVLSGDPASTQQVEAIRTHINNRAVETAGAANFTTGYGDENYLLLHSDRRTDGIILDALIHDQPDSDLIPKVVNGLLAHRTQGRWHNTQENAFILLALDRYFNTYESVEPDFVAHIWLGEEYVGGHEFEGRTTERRLTQVPMAYLVDEAFAQVDRKDLTIGKEGPGRLYYRLGLRYAPTDLELPPLDMGFVVQREYEAVDDPADVSRDEDGVWHIRAGARVRVRITMVADNRRYHVALVDPLPAGLEIINPALAVSESVPPDPNDPARRTWWWWGTWYEHQNLRDQRAEAFATLLWDGVYTYSYVARATTPGEFVVPPAKAEEMYSPEVFGRSGVDRVVVE